MVFSIINHPFGGTPIYGNLQIDLESIPKASTSAQVGPQGRHWGPKGIHVSCSQVIDGVEGVGELSPGVEMRRGVEL